MRSMTGMGLVAMLLLISGLSGCAWLKPTVKASDVSLITDEMLAGCTRLGTTHVSLMDRLDQLLQNEGQQADELVALARNSAVQFGGNAIMALTGINDGTQSFAIFRCEPGAGS